MPSSIRRLSVGTTPMVGWDFPPSYRPSEVLIGPASMCALGAELGGMAATIASATYPAANRALGYMFCLSDYFLVRKVWWANGTTATTDNADVGVYTEDGATLLVSAGATAISGATTLQEVDVTDTLLKPGRYWCVYNQNGVTATPICYGLAIPNVRAMGWTQFAGAVPLGSTFTPAAIAAVGVPYFGIASRTQAA